MMKTNLSQLLAAYYFRVYLFMFVVTNTTLQADITVDSFFILYIMVLIYELYVPLFAHYYTERKKYLNIKKFYT